MNGDRVYEYNDLILSISSAEVHERLSHNRREYRRLLTLLKLIREAEKDAADFAAFLKSEAKS